MRWRAGAVFVGVGGEGVRSAGCVRALHALSLAWSGVQVLNKRVERKKASRPLPEDEEAD